MVAQKYLIAKLVITSYATMRRITYGMVSLSQEGAEF
jgi:hypothetical protein